MHSLFSVGESRSFSKLRDARLEAMNQCDKLTDGDVQLLLDAYSTLRTIENRLQMIEDQQTHTLPQDELARARIQFAMGCPDWSEFMDALTMQRVSLQLEFTCLMRVELEPEQEHPEELKDPIAMIEDHRAAGWRLVGLEEVLGKMGLEDGAKSQRDELHSPSLSSAWRIKRQWRHYALALIPKMIEIAFGRLIQPTAESPVRCAGSLFRPNLHGPAGREPPSAESAAELVRLSPWGQTKFCDRPTSSTNCCTRPHCLENDPGNLQESCNSPCRRRGRPGTADESPSQFP